MRDARPRDVAPICRFGAAVVPPHYAPLIGAEAAHAQVARWWNEPYVGAAVGRRSVVVAETGHRIVGVAQRGTAGSEHVIYKLYVAPDQRGAGIGPRLIEALVDQLPADVEHLAVEHLAANTRAAAFYEREGFTVVRVEPDDVGDPARAQVWRVRRLVP